MRPCTVNDDIIIHSKTEQSILRVKNDIIILSPFLEAGHNSISVRLISYKRYLISPRIYLFIKMHRRLPSSSLTL